MMNRCVWFALISAILFFLTVSNGFSAETANKVVSEDRASLTNEWVGQDDISIAYRTLTKTGNYEEKKKQLMVFSGNFENPRVIAMIVDLLTYSYDNEAFKENDQQQYYDDVIAENLIKILARTGKKETFPVLIRIAFNNRNHRDVTVKEAWKAIQGIKW